MHEMRLHASLVAPASLEVSVSPVTPVRLGLVLGLELSFGLQFGT